MYPPPPRLSAAHPPVRAYPENDSSSHEPSSRSLSLSQLALASGVGSDVLALHEEDDESRYELHEQQRQDIHSQQSENRQKCKNHGHAVSCQEKRSRFALEIPALRLLVVILVIALGIVSARSYFLSSSLHSVQQEEKKAEMSSNEPLEKQEEENDEEKEKEEGKEEGENIIIYISGAVTHPGVYSIPAGGRLADAVDQAGGLTQEADSSRINLAEYAKDSMHIHIPRQGEPLQEGQASASGVEPSLININTATANELESLPGIGPTLAAGIISWRQKNGPCKHIDDLLSVSGIGESTLGKFREKITCS